MVHGFFNIGNSCYLSASLQCLINLKPFMTFRGGVKIIKYETKEGEIFELLKKE